MQKTRRNSNMGVFTLHVKRNFVIEQLENLGVTTHEGVSIYELSYNDLKRLLALRKYCHN